jgi:hypothetical protein
MIEPVSSKDMPQVIAFVTDVVESSVVERAGDLHLHSDVVLYAKTDRRLSANSEAGALAMIEALCGAVVHRSKDSLRNATELTERLLPYLYVGNQHNEPKAPASGRKKKSRS